MDFEELGIDKELDENLEFDPLVEFSEQTEQLDELHLRQTERLEDGIYRDTISRIPGVEPMEGMETVIGEPLEDMEHWHMQESEMSCAVACQEFIAEELLDVRLEEKDLVEFAISKGWYDPKSGTTVENVGRIMEHLGLDVERKYNGTLEDLEQVLSEGGKVIVGINNGSMMIPDRIETIYFPALTANHAVQVIGIDRTHPDDIKVILNDPGIEGGRGAVCDLSEFQTAWKTSGGFFVSAYRKIS